MIFYAIFLEMYYFISEALKQLSFYKKIDEIKTSNFTCLPIKIS